MTTLVRYCI